MFEVFLDNQLSFVSTYEGFINSFLSFVKKELNDKEKYNNFLQLLKFDLCIRFNVPGGIKSIVYENPNKDYDIHFLGFYNYFINEDKLKVFFQERNDAYTFSYPLGNKQLKVEYKN